MAAGRSVGTGDMAANVETWVKSIRTVEKSCFPRPLPGTRTRDLTFLPTSTGATIIVRQRTNVPFYLFPMSSSLFFFISFLSDGDRGLSQPVLCCRDHQPNQTGRGGNSFDAHSPPKNVCASCRPTGVSFDMFT